MKYLLFSIVISLSLCTSIIGMQEEFRYLTEAQSTTLLEESFRSYKTLSIKGKEYVRRICLLDIELFKKTGEVFQAVFDKACAYDNPAKIFSEYDAQVEEVNTCYSNEEFKIKNELINELSAPDHYNTLQCASNIHIAMLHMIGKMEMSSFEAIKVLLDGHIRNPFPEVTQDMVNHIKKTRSSAMESVQNVIQQYQDILDQLT